MAFAAFNGKDVVFFGKGDGNQFEQLIFGQLGELLAKRQIKLQGQSLGQGGRVDGLGSNQQGAEAQVALLLGSKRLLNGCGRDLAMLLQNFAKWLPRLHK